MHVIASCLLALCACVSAVGYGSGLARLLRIRPNLGDLGVLGLLCFGILGCALHFAVALSTSTQAAVLAGGAIMGAILWRQIRRDASIGFVTIAAVGVLVLLQLRGTSYVYDYGLYYLQTFKWNREFPIVAGLGNLHGRFAFNSMIFVIDPLVDRLEVGWIANFLAVVFVMLSLIVRFRRKEPLLPADVTRWFIALAILQFVAKSWLGFMSADNATAVLIIYWVALALGLSQSRDRRTDFTLLVLSAVLIITIKITAAPLLGFTAAIWWFRRKEHLLGKTAGLIGVAALTIWMLRGVWLSGCAIYPMQQACFAHLPWAESAKAVDDEQMSIRSWARIPDPNRTFESVMHNWNWLPEWLGQPHNKRWMLLLAAGVVLGAVALASGRLKAREGRNDLALICAGLAMCIGVWFWSAPAVRFGMGFLLAASLLGFALAGAAWLNHPRLHRYAPQIMTVLMVSFGIRNLLGLRAESFYVTIPKAAVYQVKITNDRELWVPQSDPMCWAQDLPCTPYVDPDGGLARVRWPANWPYHYVPELAPPKGWQPPAGVHGPH